MFKTHPVNIDHVKAALKVHDEIWFHGDGNIYDKKLHSDNRKNFSNDASGPSTYRLHFKKGDRIPETVEEMNKAFLQAKNKEVVDAARPKEVANVSTFSVGEPVSTSKVLSDEEELQRLIEEENKSK